MIENCDRVVIAPFVWTQLQICALFEAVIVACGPVLTTYKFFPNTHNRHPIACPQGQAMGVSFVSSNYDLYSTLTIAAVCIMVLYLTLLLLSGKVKYNTHNIFVILVFLHFSAGNLPTIANSLRIKYSVRLISYVYVYCQNGYFDTHKQFHTQ